MFVGSINSDLRSLVAELALKWKGKPVYVACSGNMTVERILHAAGVTELHGNDVSLYSCALGGVLAGKPIEVRLKPDTGYEWMRPFMEPGLPTVATLLLCMEYFKFAGRGEAYHQRMSGAYERRWPSMHAATVEKLTKLLEGLRLTSFTAGDCVPFLEAAPADAVVICEECGQKRESAPPPLCDDCEEEPSSKTWDNAEVHYWLPTEKAVLDLCAECWDKRDNAEPPDPDGEAFRGGEAAAYQAEQCDAARRLK